MLFSNWCTLDGCRVCSIHPCADYLLVCVFRDCRYDFVKILYDTPHIGISDALLALMKEVSECNVTVLGIDVFSTKCFLFLDAGRRTPDGKGVHIHYRSTISRVGNSSMCPSVAIPFSHEFVCPCCYFHVEPERKVQLCESKKRRDKQGLVFHIIRLYLHIHPLNFTSCALPTQSIPALIYNIEQFELVMIKLVRVTKPSVFYVRSIHN